MRKHRLVLVGWLSSFTGYLDMTNEEALERFNESNSYPESNGPPHVKVIEFDEFFHVYDAQEWED